MTSLRPLDRAGGGAVGGVDVVPASRRVLERCSLGAAVLGVVNAVVRPVLTILTLPITILTLGLFYLVVNGGGLRPGGGLVPGFEVAVVAGGHPRRPGDRPGVLDRRGRLLAGHPKSSSNGRGLMRAPASIR